MQQGDYSAKSTVLSVVGVNAVWINAKCKATTTNGVYHKKKKERHIYIYIYIYITPHSKGHAGGTEEGEISDPYAY